MTLTCLNQSNKLSSFRADFQLNPINQKQTYISNFIMKANDRVINTLPLPPITEYTPYNQSNFDAKVLELYKPYKKNFEDNLANIHQESKCSNPLALQLFTDKNNQTVEQNCYPTNTVNHCTVNTFAKRITNKSCKVVLCGDVAVGKTSLVNRFGCDSYSDAYNTTIGVDFDLQKFDILGQTFILQLWDTAGLERFKCITTSYYRGSNVALLVFDVSNLASLANVIRWKEEVIESSKVQHPLSFNINGDDKYRPYQQASQNQDEPLLFLVGTKSDLLLSESNKLFVHEQANNIAKNLKAELWFVSSRTGHNVANLFKRVAALAFNRCIVKEINRIKFETSTLGACMKEKFIIQQKQLLDQSVKFIKITKKKAGDEKRSKCINIQCVIK